MPYACNEGCDATPQLDLDRCLSNCPLVYAPTACAQSCLNRYQKPEKESREKACGQNQQLPAPVGDVYLSTGYWTR